MKKLFYIAFTTILLSVAFLSCSKDTQTYADLVSEEESAIDHFLGKENISTIRVSEEEIKSWTKSVLTDSVNPATLIRLGQWYEITEGDFKRLCFCIKNWGDGYQSSAIDHSNSFYTDKFVTGSYSVVRYDSLFRMTDTLDIKNEVPLDNYKPYGYELIYNWNEYYYATTYYAYSYSAGSSYECTSGGLGFPLRFLWNGGEAALIVPFSLVPSEYANYYYTLYYGKVKYTKPTYIPE